MKTLFPIITSFALLGVAAIAKADEPVVAGAEETSAAITAEAPGFATLDRMDGRSRLSVSSSLSIFDGDNPDFNNRLDLHGQIVGSSGLGGYVALPFSVFVEPDSVSCKVPRAP